jgi:dTDP-N-acetylfucosamine:lipid II N-acetylfucosaminyltransferase
MRNKKILHCMHAEKFIESFVDLVDDNFEYTRHLFIINKSEKFKTKKRSNVIITEGKLFKIKNLLVYIFSMNSAEKIFLHSLTDNSLTLLLYFQPWLVRKCYWIIWGGDLYAHEDELQDWKWQRREFFRRSVIRRIGHLVTFVPGDVELARKWYGATGKYHECIMYASNVYQDYTIKSKPYATVNIQIGNSADPSNNHFEMLEKLKPFREQNIAIYAPLSYGDQAHAKMVINAGKTIFGDKFKPKTDFMPHNRYLEFLNKIDIAVFAHKRQQGMGNTITLLGLGKKVYMRSDVSQWSFFKNLGISIFDANEFDLEALNQVTKQTNTLLVKQYFSKVMLLDQLRRIFAE